MNFFDNIKKFFTKEKKKSEVSELKDEVKSLKETIESMKAIIEQQNTSSAKEENIPKEKIEEEILEEEVADDKTKFFIMEDNFGLGLFKTNSRGNKVEKCITRYNLDDEELKRIMNISGDDMLDCLSNVYDNFEDAFEDFKSEVKEYIDED